MPGPIMLALVRPAEYSPCPDEQTLAAFISGDLHATVIRSIEAHLADCFECQSVVGAAAFGIELGTGSARTDGPRPGEPEPGEMVAGKYRIDGVLGSGGMGMVFAARHVELGHRVAIKVLCSTDGAAEARFLREAMICARFVNDHVPRVFDLGHTPSGVPFFAMEHLEGEDLACLLARDPVPPALAIELVLQACVAMQEAHAAGVIHRDLKPSNLFLVRRTDGKPLLKVLDFGISKVVAGHELGTSNSLTLPQAILGSPTYMSPEQIRASKVLDARSDIWSIGVILYELLTQQRPFSGSTISALLVSIATDTPTAPSSLVAYLPKKLDAVVLRCLEKEPAARFASVEELSAALRGISSGAAIAKRQEHHANDRGKYRSRLFVSLVAASLVSVALAALTGRGLVWRAVVAADSNLRLRSETANEPPPDALPALAVQPALVPASPPINPFLGADLFVNPDYARNVRLSIVAHLEDAELLRRAKQMPTAYWVFSIDAVAGTDGVLADVDREARQTGHDVLPVFVLFNLPARDCSTTALDSELTIAKHGEQRYREEFIDPLALAFAARPAQRVVVILEPNALPNLVTGLVGPHCATLRDIQLSALAYAVTRLSLPNVFIYLDAGNASWLGTDSARNRLVQLTKRVLVMAGGFDRIRGFTTNVAGYIPLEGNDIGRLDPGNPSPNEVAFVEHLSADLEREGIVGKRFIIDTSRNGRSGVRVHADDYCNLVGAGLGERPRAAPRPLVDAYYWVKSPGVSDGGGDRSAASFDSHCAGANSIPGGPHAGQWFDSFFVSLVKNANPPL
jgi:eukaryotic-like serine/threonine-protein kinase